MQTQLLRSWKLGLLFILASSTVFCQNVTVPRTPSPAASVSQTIGISTVEVRYSRPSVRGREIWGALVPYGWNIQNFGNGKSAPWRAGANENTTLRISHPARIQGKPVAAGTYGLFFVINKDNTGEVILSKDNRSWGSFFYEPAQDALKEKINIRTIAPTELLTYEFINLSKNSAELVLNWEKKQFPVNIEFDVDKLVMENAEEELKGPAGFGWQGYLEAANYGLQNKVNLAQAAKWVDQAVAQNKSFATLMAQSNLQAAQGQMEVSERTMKAAQAMANENELNLYGYQLLGAGNTDQAINVFIQNTNKFPKSANTWDSLGEAYVTKGDKQKAIASFKKSLSLSPTAATRANSEKFLQQLGAR